MYIYMYIYMCMVFRNHFIMLMGPLNDSLCLQLGFVLNDLSSTACKALPLLYLKERSRVFFACFTRHIPF
jgi:hypothetical protein